MKIMLVFLAWVMVLVCPCSAGVTEPGVLALGDWLPEPVANEHHFKLRGRLAICEYPAHRGFSLGRTSRCKCRAAKSTATPVGLIGEVHWNAASVHCELTERLARQGRCPCLTGDEYGELYRGAFPGSSSPAFSSMRLRGLALPRAAKWTRKVS